MEAELERLLKASVIEPVRSSDWAASIVPVTKPDGSVRICRDYKMTVNKAVVVETYPLPPSRGFDCIHWERKSVHQIVLS